MAVSFTDTIIDDFVWSLERPMHLRYSKDADNSAVVVSIAITQGSYSKTLTLKYSGLIKEIEMNITDLIKVYFQRFDMASETFSFLITDVNSRFYTQSRTQKVLVTITDDDNSINTTQFYISNGNYGFENDALYFGGDYYIIPDPNGDTEYNIPVTRMLFNYPIYRRKIRSDNYEVRLKIQRYRISDDSLIDEIYYIDPTSTDERVIAVPVGYENIPGSSPSDLAGVKVVFTNYTLNVAVWEEGSSQEFIFNYAEPCDITRKKEIYFEGRYGGSELLTFANRTKNISKNSNNFTLQNGDKIKLNVNKSGGGSLISEYVNKADQDIYKSLYLSEKVQFYEDITMELKSILLTSKSHRIKQIDNSEMKQYTFAYEEVERLKY